MVVLSKKKKTPQQMFQEAVNNAEVSTQQQSKTTANSGTYNPTKKEFRTLGGKSYPTTNPDFIPDPNSEQIKFNKDKSVTISPRGSDIPINISREEYEVLEGGAGNVTNKVKEVERQRANLTPIDAGAIQQEQGQILQDEFNKNLNSTGLQKEKFGAAAEELTNIPLVRQALSTGAALIEAVGSSVGIPIGKKSVGITQAEQIYSDYAALIESQIAMGGSMIEIENSLKTATQATLKLQQEAHGLGRLNLRYWLDEGASIEAQAERQLQNLRSLANKANMAQAARAGIKV
jgi:hypothetical protein